MDTRVKTDYGFLTIKQNNSPTYNTSKNKEDARK